MSIVPKIRNKPPKCKDSEQWVSYIDIPPPAAVFMEGPLCWRYGWEKPMKTGHHPAMNVEGMFWLCTDLEWLRKAIKERNERYAVAFAQFQRIEAMRNQCRCSNHQGLFGGLFGPW